MKRILKAGAVASAALAVGLMVPSAHAICGGTVFTLLSDNYQADASSGSDTASVQAAIESNWWKLGSGNPAAGVGNDNGIYQDDGTGGFGNQWLYYPTGGGAGSFFVAGITDGGNTDGCPDADQNGATPDQAALAVCDRTGKWAVSTGTQDAATDPGLTTFKFGAGPLLPTPGITVTNAQRLSATSHRVFVTAPALTLLDDAFYPGPGAESNAANVITGVRLFTKTIARNAALDPNRHTSNPGPPPWTDSGIVLAPGAAGQIDITCATNSDTYIGLAPVFDGPTPFRSGCVTTGPRLVQCGPTIAEPPSKFKRVARPQPTQRQ